jgi:hypothetical protein
MAQTGPVSADQLQSFVRAGRVLPSDLVWTEGMEQWLSVEETPGLSAAVSEVTALAWHYGIDGNRWGPTNLLSLREFVSNGEVGREWLAWSEGMPEWATISGLSEFKDLFQPEDACINRPDAANSVRQRSSTESTVPDEGIPKSEPWAKSAASSPRASTGIHPASAVSDLRSNAAKAAQLVSKQAEWTKAGVTVRSRGLRD